LLHDRGADIHAKDDDALRWACRHKHLEIIKYLLDRGADIHTNNDEVLRFAFYNNHTKVVKLLIENGANKNVLKYF